MNEEHIIRLCRSGLLTWIDIHFARFISDISGNDDLGIFLGAAFASNATGNGDVCFDLASMAGKALLEKHGRQNSLICPKLFVWRKKLGATSAVGKPGDFCPLVLDEKNRLYLYRYWDYEKKLSDSIKERSGKDVNKEDINKTVLNKSLKRLFPGKVEKDTDWQKMASIIPVFKRFCVISGGPGTGKTTVITKILALLLEHADGKKKRIFLAAPTGKAAARLGESIRNAKEKLNCNDYIKEAIPEETYTIHRMLKTIPGSPYFHYNAENPLPADIVVVDEASMVDLALMSKLVQALSVDAGLILVGDKDQLSSVEAGSVLGDICDRKNIHVFSENFCKKIEELTGEKPDTTAGQGVLIKQDSNRPGLHDCIVILRKSYRFSDRGGIGELSRAVNKGDTAGALRLLKKSDDKSISWKESIASPNEQADLFRIFAENIIKAYSKYLKTDDPHKALELFNRFRILCAVKIGPFGVYAINRLVEDVLAQDGLIKPGNLSYNPWYRGRPVLITANDYNLELFNGDIGITMPAQGSNSNELYVFFQGTSGELRRFLPHRLPSHETVYAMTVHKSQGSEFENIHFVLPDKDYPLLTRELIYTAVTRAKQKISIWASETIIKVSILRRIERTSGLRNALWE